MGLFGFVGKAIGGIAKAVGKVALGAAKTAIGASPLGVGLRLGKGILGGVRGIVAIAKSQRYPTKTAMLSRGGGLLAYKSGQMNPVLKMGPPSGTVMSGSTPLHRGSRAHVPGAKSPVRLTATGRGGVRRASRKRSKVIRRGRLGIKRRRRAGGRKLKFGSPAWRRKYLGHGRRRRSRRR